MALNLGGITLEVVVTKGDYIHGIGAVDVIAVPGLSYYASVEAAEAALAKLKSGECPMLHTIEAGFAPRACPVCGTMETVDPA